MVRHIALDPNVTSVLISIYESNSMEDLWPSFGQIYSLLTDDLEGSNRLVSGEGGIEERDLLDLSKINGILLQVYET